MNKPSTKKLTLSTTTVRALAAKDLAELAGGQKPQKPESITRCYCPSDVCPSNICF